MVENELMGIILGSIFFCVIFTFLINKTIENIVVISEEYRRINGLSRLTMLRFKRSDEGVQFRKKVITKIAWFIILALLLIFLFPQVIQLVKFFGWI